MGLQSVQFPSHSPAFSKWHAALLLAILTIGLSLAQIPETAALNRLGAIWPLTPHMTCLVYDNIHNMAYTGPQGSITPGVIDRVNLTSLTSDTLTLNTGENGLNACVIDPVNGFAYFGTGTAPGMIVKIRLSNFTRVGALTLNAGEDSIISAAIDVAGGFAYFGTGTSPGKIVKVRLSDFTRVGALTLNSGESTLSSAAIDSPHGYLYFATYTSPAILVKVRLSDFSRIGSLTLNLGENNTSSAVIDTAGGFIFLGTFTSPGVVVKVRLSDLTRVGALTLNSGENYLHTAVISPTRGVAYFATWTSGGGKVIAVKLSDLTRVGTLALDFYEPYLFTSIIDDARGFAYFGTSWDPSSALVKIDLAVNPSAPTSLTAMAGPVSVTLNWNVPSFKGGASITGYKIYRATASGAETLLTSIGNQTTYQDTSVLIGSTYFYKITALNSGAESSYSNEASATPNSSAITFIPVPIILIIVILAAFQFKIRRTGRNKD